MEKPLAIFLSAFLLVGCFKASAADKSADRLNVRGIFLGTLYRDMKKEFPLDCTHAKVTDVKRFDVKCYFRDPVNLPHGFDSYGGNKMVMPSFQFLGERLSRIDLFMPQTSNSCEVVAGDLKDKFGSPTAHENYTWTWHKYDESLSISCKGKTAGVSLVSDEALAVWKRYHEEMERQKANPRLKSL